MKTSDLEEVFAWHLRSLDVEEPEREFPFAGELGRRFRFDFAWPRERVYVEIEGGVWIKGRHNRAAGYIRDTEKYNLATMLGWRGLRFTGEDIRKNPIACVGMVKALLSGEDGTGSGLHG